MTVDLEAAAQVLVAIGFSAVLMTATLLVAIFIPPLVETRIQPAVDKWVTRKLPPGFRSGFATVAGFLGFVILVAVMIATLLSLVWFFYHLGDTTLSWLFG